MYLHLLTSVLDDWVEELNGAALVDYAITCRAEIQARNPRRNEAADIALSAEISYDRALVKLCAEHLVDVDITEFSHPLLARSRLERALAGKGVVLAPFTQVRREG
jgi:hypothetical protein